MIKEYLDWLGPLTNGERYYCTLIARRKYDRNVPDNVNMLERCTAKNAKDLIRKIKRMKGPYYAGDYLVPKASTAIYMYPNPRSIRKASKLMIQDGIKRVFANEELKSPESQGYTAMTRAKSCSTVVSFDIDDTDYEHIFEIASAFLNQFAAIRTHSGVHLLVKPQNQIHKDWHKKLMRQFRNIDKTGDLMSPIPGTYIGGKPCIFRTCE